MGGKAPFPTKKNIHNYWTFKRGEDFFSSAPIPICYLQLPKYSEVLRASSQYINNFALIAPAHKRKVVCAVD